MAVLPLRGPRWSRKKYCLCFTWRRPRLGRIRLLLPDQPPQPPRRSLCYPFLFIPSQISIRDVHPSVTLFLPARPSFRRPHLIPPLHLPLDQNALVTSVLCRRRVRACLWDIRRRTSATGLVLPVDGKCRVSCQWLRLVDHRFLG